MNDSGNAASKTNAICEPGPLQYSPPSGPALDQCPHHSNRPRHHGAIQDYDRCRDLPELIPLWPHELSIETRKDHEALIRRLRQALRAQRKRGICGHWSYNLTRHDNLARAYRFEVDLFYHKVGQLKR